MRKMILCGLVASLAVATLFTGCSSMSSGTTATASTSPAEAVYRLRAGYDAAFLAPAATYNELQRCAIAATPATVCSSPSVVDQLRKADAAAKALLDGAEDVVRNHPSLDASAALAAASSAVDAATKLVTIYVVTKPPTPR